MKFYQYISFLVAAVSQAQKDIKIWVDTFLSSLFLGLSRRTFSSSLIPFKLVYSELFSNHVTGASSDLTIMEKLDLTRYIVGTQNVVRFSY